MKLWWLSVLLGATSLAAEISSAAVMYLLPNFYLAITDDNQTEFWRLVCIALVMITLVSILYSIKTYLSGICQVNWRVSLIKYMHSNIRSVYDKLASSTDQRVTQDVDSFCEQLADLLEKLIVSPVMLVFYSVYLAVTFGVLAVLACLVYFAIGSVLSNLFSNAIMSLVYRQSHYEGEFRLHHSHYMLHQSVIRLLFGGSSEVSEMNLIFSSLMENKLSLIKSILNLNLVTNWFAHAGGIVSYIIIGCAIFYTYPSDSSQRIVLLARGSFACMNLIYVCTSILSAANVYITVKGLYKRVQEVCDSSVYHLILYEESTRAPCGTMCGFCTKSKQSHMQGSQCCPKVMGYDVLSDDDGSSKSVKFLEEGLLMSPVISTTTIATGIKPTCLNAMSSSSVPSSNDVMLKIMHLNLSTQHIRTDQCAPPHTSAYRLLIRDLSIDVTSSMRLLITGKSGVGKSSLVQYIAQCVSEKDSESSYSVRDVQVLCDICCIMYCPQTPYHQLQSSMWDYLAYPGRGDDMWQQHGDRFIESIRNTFAELRLIHIAFGALYVANKIYNLEDWRRALQTRQIGVMSLGERQSLCIAKCITRKLLCHTEKPCLLLLDEATSALDEESEDIEYQAIQQHFACYISIGHRSTVRRFHGHELRLKDDGTYVIKTLP